MKYDKAIVERICDLISKDSYTIPEICENVGISETTYHKWKMTKAEFSECIKKAQNKFDELILSEAKKSLRKKVCGYMIQETKTVTVGTGKRDENDEPVAVKEYTVTDKYFQPDTAAIIFTLTNRDPENWKNRINNELTGKDGENLFQGVVIQKTYEPDMKEGGGV